MTEPTLSEVIERAVALLEAATSSDDFDGIQAVVEPVATMGQSAVDAGVALLSGTVEQRQAGCAILGAMCTVANEKRWSLQVGLALAAAAEVETDDNAAWSIAMACGQVGDPVVMQTLVGFASHPDDDVRAVVAGAITSARDYDAPPSAELLRTLLLLMTDTSDEVRDWSTFGLGTLLDVDSDEIRDGLAARLDDPHEDTRYEALIGLARRRDARAIPVTVSALQIEEVWRLTVKAAEHLAAIELLPYLLRLSDVWESSGNDIGLAIAACDPEARALTAAQMHEFLELLQQAFDQIGARLTPYLYVDVRDTDTVLGLTAAEDAPKPKQLWGFGQLMDRSGDAGVPGAVEFVVADLGDLSV